MNRRTYLKSAGLAVGGTAIGGIALSGNAVAGDTNLEGPDQALTATTDDGSIQYVSYGGRLRYEWDGLDSTAEYGGYEVETRVQRRDGSYANWRSHGADSGPLGDGDGGEFEEGDGNSSDTWGGGNDSNSGPGTEGFFQFKYGELYDQKNYGIVSDGDEYSEVLMVGNPWNASRVESATDGKSNTTNVQIRKTCRVYDDDPDDGGSVIGVPASDTATMTIKVTNEAATGETGGEIEGDIGTDGT